jgi:membrane fusion protein (multidrug efflux system)
MSRLSALLAPACVTVVASAVLAGCGRSAAPPPAAPPPPQVSVVTIKPRSVALTTVLPGRTVATTLAEVRPQVTGIVQTRTFQEGSEVKAGTVLYTLDPATYQAAFDSAKAQLARAEANREAMRLKAVRTKELVAQNFVSQQAYEDAAAALQLAEADVQAAKAAVETARINLANTKVTAPVSGRVGKSAVTPGALVTANQSTALVTIQQLNPIYVDVTQSSADVLRLKRALERGEIRRTPRNEARVGLLFEDGTKYGHEGALQFSDVTVDPATGAITLRALFPNPEGILLPGMYVRATLEEGVRENALLVPQQAVTRDNKGDAIAMVVGADGKVELRKLQAVRTIGSDWLVDGGVAAGERVVVEGLQRARPGTVVQASEVSAAPATANATPGGAAGVVGAGASGAAPGALPPKPPAAQPAPAATPEKTSSSGAKAPQS